MRRTLALACLVAAPVALYACAEDDTAVPGPKDAGASDSSVSETSTTDSATKDATADSPTDTGTDASVPVRCTQAEFDAVAGPNGGDLTAQPGADIGFPNDGTIQQYANRCVKVKLNADITFAGKFSSHPLEPKGGTTPSFIPTQSTDPDGGMITFKASALGTFGYQCNFHPEQMFGAIQVVP
ncbi:MAG: hypothetical protein JST00_01420 [Deltaproteobacteria bacterium]|nr:hypothetical protein [Deltaproteobacteria bacterium]